MEEVTPQEVDIQTGGGADGDEIEFPVDNNTYNLLKVLTSKLEALQAYATYERDADDSSRGILQELTERDRQSVDRVMQALRETLR